jgi:hypothetical protein
MPASQAGRRGFESHRPLHFSQNSMKKNSLTNESIFFCLFVFFSNPVLLLSQVTADDSRPFGQGQVIDLPGTTDYLGDLPHEITVINDPVPYHTITGLSAAQVGWMGSGGMYPTGSNSTGVGVFFDDIPYPFPSAAILNWIPSTGSFEFLDFPAGAWWGPCASTGAVQLQLPALPEKSETFGSIWGGSEGLWGGVGQYQNEILSVNGNYQHEALIDSNSADTFSTLSKINWIKNDSFKLESGFLGSQWLSNDSWYSFFTSIKLDGANFQSFQIKPFFQSAQFGGQNVKEMGSHIQYQFNMAGLFESHLIGGWSRDYFGSSPGSVDLNKEFVQNTEAFDALGFISGDLAFRWDFSNDSETIFSTLLGLQGSLGDWLLLGDYAKGTDTTLLEDVQQADFGVRYQPDNILNFSCKYIHEQIGTTVLNGGRIKFQLDHDSPLLMVFKKMRLELTEQCLQEQWGTWTNDVGGKLQFSLFQRDHFWFEGRDVSNQPFYKEMGTDYFLNDYLKIFISVANLDNIPVSWPDPISLEGRIFWLGIEIKS